MDAVPAALAARRRPGPASSSTTAPAYERLLDPTVGRRERRGPRVRRAAARRRRRLHPRPADRPTSGCCPQLRPPRAVRSGTYSPSAVVWHVGARGAAGRRHGPPQHPLRRRLGRQLRGAHRRPQPDARPVPPRHGPDVTDPSLASRGLLDALRAGAGAQPRRAPSTGRRPGRRWPSGCTGFLDATRLPDRHRHRAPHDAARVARPRHARRARPSRSPTPSGRPGRSGRATSSAGCPGLVFAGSGTVPGVGVPMVLVSGKLAADRVDAYLPPRPGAGPAPARAGRWRGGTATGSGSWCEHRRRHGDRPGRAGLPRSARASPASTARPTTGARSCCPPERRRHVYAVYALCRLADDIVDAPRRHRPGAGRPRRPPRLAALRRALPRRSPTVRPTQDPVHRRRRPQRAHRAAIAGECFDRFFRRDGPGPHARRPTRRGTTCSATWTARPPSSAR